MGKTKKYFLTDSLLVELRIQSDSEDQKQMRAAEARKKTKQKSTSSFPSTKQLTYLDSSQNDGHNS